MTVSPLITGTTRRGFRHRERQRSRQVGWIILPPPGMLMQSITVCPVSCLRTPSRGRQAMRPASHWLCCTGFALFVLPVFSQGPNEVDPERQADEALWAAIGKLGDP